jgi:hypothetical protein
MTVRFLPAFAMLCSLAAHPVPALADETLGDQCDTGADTTISVSIPETLLDDLVGWIARNTDYDVSLTYRSPPAISLCEAGATIIYEGADLIVDPALRAAYDLRARRIHLVAPWSPENTFDVSVLLHELIHDVQLANRGWDCIGAPEFEAYWLQDKWLAERGIRPGFDWAAIWMLSRCPPNTAD